MNWLNFCSNYGPLAKEYNSNHLQCVKNSQRNDKCPERLAIR
jgi:hypothetical protein